MPEVKKERSGWRDLALSLRHKMWGWDCPAVDLDFFFLNTTRGNPLHLLNINMREPLPNVPHIQHIRQ